MITSLSDNTIDGLIRAGNFPKPRQTSDRRVAWLLRELREWAESRPVSDLPPPPNSGWRKGQVSDQDTVSGDARDPRE
jgi:prophage regulatory protein